MTEHVCGVFGQVKRTGCCTCCIEPVYEIRSVFPDGHPLAGHPNRIGPMLEHGCQVEFLLSDGSEVDIAFCVRCARHLRPEHYALVWERVQERTDLAVKASNRRELERRLALRQVLSVYPIAILRWRREDPSQPGRLIVDRRRTEPAHG